MKLFEVFLTPGGTASQLLTEDALEASGAQVFTPQEAKLVGLEGIPEGDDGASRVFIACSPSDEQFIASRLEASAAVSSFKLHDI